MPKVAERSCKESLNLGVYPKPSLYKNHSHMCLCMTDLQLCRRWCKHKRWIHLAELQNSDFRAGCVSSTNYPKSSGWGEWFWNVNWIQSICLLSVCSTLGTQWGMRSPFFLLPNVIENCVFIMAGTLSLTHQARSRAPSSVLGSFFWFQRPGQPGSPMSPAPWSLLRAIHTKAQSWKPRSHGIQPLLPWGQTPLAL